MKTPLLIGPIFGIVALANAAAPNDLDEVVNVQLPQVNGEHAGIGVRGTYTSLPTSTSCTETTSTVPSVAMSTALGAFMTVSLSDVGNSAAPTSTSTIFDTIISTIISCAPTVTNCPAHSTTLMTFAVPQSTVPITQLSFSDITSSALSSSTTTLLVTFTPPQPSISIATGPESVISVSSTLLTGSLSPTSVSTATASSTTSSASESGFTTGYTLDTTTTHGSFTWNTGFSTASTFAAHSGFTAETSSAIGTVESTTAISTPQSELEGSSTSVFTPSIASLGTPISVPSYTPAFSETRSAIGIFTSIGSSDISSTLTSTIIATSTIYPSTITMGTVTVLPSSQLVVPSTFVPESDLSSLATTEGTTTLQIAQLTSVETTTSIISSVSTESITQPSTTTQTLVLATPIITPVIIYSAGTNAVSGPSCAAPDTTTVTAFITLYSSISSITTIPEISSSSETIIGNLTPIISCAQDNCLRQFLQSSAVLGFCADYTVTVNTASTSLPAYVSMCSNGPTQISSACSCVNGVAPSSSSTTTLTTSLPPTTEITYTTLPASGAASSNSLVCHCPFIGIQIPGTNATTVGAPSCTCTPAATSYSFINGSTPSSPSAPRATYTSTVLSTFTPVIGPSPPSTSSPTTFSGEATDGGAGAFKIAFVVAIAMIVALVGEI